MCKGTHWITCVLAGHTPPSLGLLAECAITFSEVKVKSLSHVRRFATLWTVAHQAPPSTGFSRQEYWSGLPFPSPSVTIQVSIYSSSDFFLYFISQLWFEYCWPIVSICILLIPADTRVLGHFTYGLFEPHPLTHGKFCAVHLGVILFRFVCVHVCVHIYVHFLKKQEYV